MADGSAFQIRTAEVKARVIHPRDLTDAECAAWRDLQTRAPDYASPILGPDFACLVGKVRSDARVAVFDGAKGFFAYHSRPGRFARPIGGPFADYAGPVVSAELGGRLPDLLAAAGLRVCQFAGRVDPWTAKTIEAPLSTPKYGLVVDLQGRASDDFLEARRALHPKRFKNFRRLENHFQREQGRADLVFGHPTHAGLEQIFAWKSAQMRRTGLVDVVRSSEGRRILRAAIDAEGPYLQAFWVALKLNGDLVAGHFGVAANGVFHPWIAAFNPNYAPWSPGNLLLRRAIQAMPEMGLTRYDLATGHDHYKKYYANHCAPVWSGAVWAAGARPRLRMRTPGAGRLSQIALCELGLGSRVLETVRSVQVLRRRKPPGHVSEAG